MLRFTLDTNCLIDLDEGRSAAADVRALTSAHMEGAIEVALTAVSASERQRGDRYISNFTEFSERVAKLGLGRLPVVQGMAYFDISFFEHAVWSGDEMVLRERQIHGVLFPTIPFSWPNYAERAGLSVEQIGSATGKKWRNAFCDRQMYWAHDHADRDIFVTSDRNFRKLEGAEGFPRAEIRSPRQAAQMVHD